MMSNEILIFSKYGVKNVLTAVIIPKSSLLRYVPSANVDAHNIIEGQETPFVKLSLHLIYQV